MAESSVLHLPISWRGKTDEGITFGVYYMLHVTTAHPRFVCDSTGTPGRGGKRLKGHIECADKYTIDRWREAHRHLIYMLLT